MLARTVLALEHPVDHPAGPKRPGIDVEVVEGQARILVDRLLLRLEDRVVLIVDALAVVDVRPVDVAGELLVVLSEGADEVPEIVAALLRLRRDGREEAPLTPWERSPCGAPVPVSATPTSPAIVDGAWK